jgi:hypothetical protein
MEVYRDPCQHAASRDQSHHSSGTGSYLILEVYEDHVTMQPLETRAILLQVVFQIMETMSTASRDHGHHSSGSYLII